MTTGQTHNSQVSRIHDFVYDLRYGVRKLRRDPTFGVVAILTLGLGIGVTTAIFSLVSAVLLRPLPFTDPSHLVALHEGIPKMGYPKMGFSAPDLAVFAREQKSFAAVGAFQNKQVNISGQGEPELVTAARISASLFPMLGVGPVRGRMFVEDDDVPGSHVAIVSSGLWRRRFGESANIIGEKMFIDRQPYTIIGIMPDSFVFPLRGPQDNSFPSEVWVPLAFTPAEMEDWGGSYSTSVIARLRPGITLDQSREEADLLSSVIAKAYPPAVAGGFHGAELKISAFPFHDEVVGPVRTLLLLLMAAVTLVLLIACANVAILLVSRAAMRQNELAVRTALGAKRSRLVRQMLAESLLLAVAGGALGCLFAYLGKNFTLALVPSTIPVPTRVALTGNVFAFAMALSLLGAFSFGLAPAFQLSFASLRNSLQEASRSTTVGLPRRSLHGIFVVLEVGLALVLLVGAGLLIRSFINLLETDPGFSPDRVLTMKLPLPREVYRDGTKVEQFYQQLLDRVSHLPGVQSAGLSSDLPLNAREMVSISVEGNDNAAAGSPRAICQSWVMGDYFQTMRIPLLQGRLFVPDDRLESESVAVVSLSAAQKFWPGQDPIGKRIRWGVRRQWQTVVGLVGDVSQGPLNTSVAPHVYRPYAQLPPPLIEDDPFADWHAMNLALRAPADAGPLIAAVLSNVHSLDPDLSADGIQTMKQVISSSLAGPEFNMALLGILAFLALFLSTIGIYGVVSYVVEQQRHEIGIRLALGATRANVLELILLRGGRLAAAGIVLGLAASIVLTSLMKGLLYGVSRLDPLTYFGVVFLLLITVLAASYIPARRAMKVDPMGALRYE